MWIAYLLLQTQEEMLRNMAYDILEQGEDVRKMLDELREAIMVTDAHSFGYSRTTGDESIRPHDDPERTSPERARSPPNISRPRASGSESDKARETMETSPQIYWTCMLDDPAVQTRHGWLCAFCNTMRPTRDATMTHLLGVHNINRCLNVPHTARTWWRKDQLKAHLLEHHALVPITDRWEMWHTSAPPSSTNTGV